MNVCRFPGIKLLSEYRFVQLFSLETVEHIHRVSIGKEVHSSAI